MKVSNIRLWVPFVEEKDALHKLLRCHGAFDRHPHGNRVTVFDEGRDIKCDPPFSDLSAANELLESRFHTFRRGLCWVRDYQRQGAGTER